ncbi:hypothetical protein PWT90_04962 [Aphanocladium album]|nr:hypothetical protein PWT90_04962 [Aphanocladium album]
MSLSSFARAACLALLAVAAKGHPAANTTPNTSSPSSSSSSRLTISLRPHDDGALLERTVYELSDPLHARYGRHLSREEAYSLLSPSPAALASVKSWLRSAAGLHDEDIHQQGQFLHVTVSAAQSATLLEKRSNGGAGVAAGLSGVLHVAAAEEAVRVHIRALHLERAGGDGAEAQNRWHSHQADPSLLQPTPTESRAKFAHDPSLSGCDDKVTPACLREKYQMKNLPTATAGKKTILGVIGFNGQTAQHADLDLFLQNFDSSSIGANFSTFLMNNGENPQGNTFPASEGNLDIQYAVALAATVNVDVRFYAVGGRNYDFIPDLESVSSPYIFHSQPKTSLLTHTVSLPAGGPYSYTEPYLAFATSLAALPDEDLPSVLSISYGVNEQLLAKDYAQHLCDVFGQLSARGVSVVAASGDAGPGQSCQSNTGSRATRFLPAFPASCPYVTAVGATRDIVGETAMELSGGGFSEYFSRPAYQDGVVDAYVARRGRQRKGLFNEKGRGIPDVAALGRNYQMYYHGTVDNADGTSASAPVVAAMIAVLNSLRAQKGRPPMGFLNTWLYTFGRFGFTEYVSLFFFALFNFKIWASSMADNVTSITTGKSSGCPGVSYSGQVSPKVDGAGWEADRGWDAATGWGTPVFSRLRRLACL